MTWGSRLERRHDNTRQRRRKEKTAQGRSGLMTQRRTRGEQNFGYSPSHRRNGGRSGSQFGLPPRRHGTQTRRRVYVFFLRAGDTRFFLDEQKELLQKISGVLSDLEFRVFTLYLNGMSSGEICDLTGKSAKSVDNALQRSKSKLLKFMDKKEK